MTRKTKALTTVLTAVALTAAIAAPASAEYRSLNSVVGAQTSSTESYSTPTAILADGGERSAAGGSGSGEPSAFSSVTALTGSDPVPSIGPAGTPSSNEFQWGDALIGAATIVVLALAAFALSSLRRRSRPGVQPSH